MDKIDFITVRPIFLSIPLLVVGIPVCLAILFLAEEMPSKRLNEKLNPNFPIFTTSSMFN